MATKMVTQRRTKSRDLETAARTHAGVTAAELRIRLAPALGEGQTLPDFEQLMHLFGTALDRRAAELGQVAEDHVDRRYGSADARKRRNAAAAAVRLELAAMRDALAGVYGPEAAASALHFEGTVRLGYEDLHAAAARVTAQLAKGPLQLPPARVEGGDLDVSGWLEKLAQPANELRAALEELRGTTKETEGRLVEKQSELAQFDQLHNRTVAVLKALMRYAGHDDLAGRLRAPAAKAVAEPAPAPAPGEPLPVPTTP